MSTSVPISEERAPLHVSKAAASSSRVLDPALRALAEKLLRAGVQNLAARQTEHGAWMGDYGGPMFLLPMYVGLCRAAGRTIEPEKASEMLRYLAAATNEDGSVGVYHGGPGCVYTTSVAYFARRALGEGPDAPMASKMRGWIRANGTPLRAASWGKFALCWMGLYEYEGINPVPPELWMLPYAAPYHPGRMWCHSRQVYLPMAWLYGTRSSTPVDALTHALREELYGRKYSSIDWKAHRNDVAPGDNYRPVGLALDAAHKVLLAYEKRPSKRLRARALSEVLAHLEYEDRVTNDIHIGPVNAVLNVLVHVFRGATGPAERGFAALEREYLWQGHDGLKMQGYNSTELWDTTFALQAIAATPFAHEVEPSVRRAQDFVRDSQILEDTPELDAHYRHRSRGAWPFSNRPHGWPITDCTAEGFKCALSYEAQAEQPVPEELLRESVRRMLEWQNEDGGWASYELQRGGAWIEALNPSQIFGDIMVDYSYTECSSAVMQALAKAKERFPGAFDHEIDAALRRGERFLRAKQRDDGSWEGSWGVCFTYGTWFGVCGLLAAGAQPGDPALARASAFLLARQRPDGAWGEDPASCSERRYVQHAEGQVVMTSWALLALVRAGCSERDAMARAVRFLAARQRSDGAWSRESWAGVFNRTCMINYDNYRHYFPVWAVGEWLRSYAAAE